MRRVVKCSDKTLRFKNRRHLTFTCSKSSLYREGRVSVHLARRGQVCTIEWFKVTPQFNRIGAVVYGSLENMMREAGFTLAELVSEPVRYDDDIGFNSPLDFWLKRGFKDTGEVEGSFGVDLHVLDKKLGSTTVKRRRVSGGKIE